MAADVIKALQLTQMENELLDVNREIKMRETIINSPKYSGMKSHNKKKLIRLVKRRNELVNDITEAALLDEG